MVWLKNFEITMGEVMEAKKLGLMFGSYNPPHLGHVQTAQMAKDQEGLDLVYMVPISQSPFKGGTLQAAFNNKVDMCHMISEGHSDWLRVFEGGLDFPTQLIDGLRHFKNMVKDVAEENPDSDLYIISGEDFRKKLMTAIRAMEVSKFLAKKVHNIETLFDMQVVYNLAARLENVCEVLNGVSILDLPRSSLADGASISSSLIRENVRNGHESITGLPDDVSEYINHHGLYLD